MHDTLVAAGPDFREGLASVLPSGNIDADGTRVLLETSGDFPNVRAIETMLTRVAASAAGLRPIFL